MICIHKNPGKVVREVLKQTVGYQHNHPLPKKPYNQLKKKSLSGKCNLVPSIRNTNPIMALLSWLGLDGRSLSVFIELTNAYGESTPKRI